MVGCGAGAPAGGLRAAGRTLGTCRRREIGFPELHGAVRAGDERRGLSGAWCLCRYGGPLSCLCRLLSQFPPDLRVQRSLDHAEHVVGHRPRGDTEKGDIETAVRIFPLNAEAVRLANGFFRKEERQRTQKQ